MYGGMDGWIDGWINGCIDSPTCHYKSIKMHYVTNFCNLLLRKDWWKVEKGRIDGLVDVVLRVIHILSTGCPVKHDCVFLVPCKKYHIKNI